MKKLLTLALFFFCGLIAFGQKPFEGMITYGLSIKSHNPQITDAQLATLMGTAQKYYIKGAYYKSVVNGKLMQWQLYDPKSNKIYNKMSNSETLLWIDAGANDDSVLSTQLNKGVTEILGYKCDELVLTCKSGVQKYYFSSKIGLDPSLYAQHRFMNWAYAMSRTHAVPLKMIVNSAQFDLEETATAIAPGPLENSFFQLPPGATTAKSPY